MCPIISTLFDSEYFPCIAWYQEYLLAEQCVIEQYEHFVRTSLRNRCYIVGPNGTITLSIPLEHGRNQRKIMKDVRVCNHENWQALHWKTLQACYRRSPYFEYFEDDLRPFFETKFAFLMDVNLRGIEIVNCLLKIEKPFSLSAQYAEKSSEEIKDNRQKFMAKNFATYTHLPHYVQVFEERLGFIHNTSILDLLFCGGRPSLNQLQNT